MDSRQDGKVAFTPDGAFAYVTSPFGNGNVSVIDTQSHTVVDFIPTGLSTQSVAITPDGAFAYVTAYGGAEPGKILAIETKSHAVVATIPMETQIPGGVKITSDGALAYVGYSRYPGSFAVIDTASNTVVDIVPTGGDELPFFAALTPQ
jgi:YVTN family beta-propeller protein